MDRPPKGWKSKHIKLVKHMCKNLKSILLLLSLVMVNKIHGQKEDYKSKEPKFEFHTNLKEQEKELQNNPLLKRFQESRSKLFADPHHPNYHFVSPENRLNDSNGLCFWQGKWHLFYQAYPPEDPRQHWGHAISTDLVQI